MSAYISLITEVLAIQLTIGTTTLSLGGILLGILVLSAGLHFFSSMSSGNAGGLGLDISGMSFTSSDFSGPLDGQSAPYDGPDWDE